jgi:hypothetical protein
MELSAAFYIYFLNMGISCRKLQDKNNRGKSGV